MFVLAVLPLAPVLVAGPTDGADIPGLVPDNICSVLSHILKYCIIYGERFPNFPRFPDLDS